MRCVSMITIGNTRAAVPLPRRLTSRRHRIRVAAQACMQGGSVDTIQLQQDRVGVAKMPSKATLSAWRNAQAVCFDVDSTLIQEESIDELADFMGLGRQVAELTHKAMSGDMKFEDALSLRLSAMRPSKDDVCAFLERRPPRLSKGIGELVKELQTRRTAVYLISGGFRDIINPIADALCIARTHIHANTILYNKDGSYAGFDSNEFTSKSGGKAAAVQMIKESHTYHPMVMIGDGATDLEARTQGAVDLFIGYGGVVERPLIKEKADWFIKDMSVLLNALNDNQTVL